MAEIINLGPVGFNPTGSYDNTRSYEKLDMVLYQGSSYVAKQSVIGQLPTNTQYWDCVATGTLKQFTYDSVAEMKLDNSLEDGMYVQTVGYYSANDGGGATYKITNEESETEYQEELENGLHATIVGKEIKTSQLGLIPNDNTQATQNFNKIVKSINSGYSLIVDGMYYIDTNETISIINKSLVINGIDNKRVGFIFNGNSGITLFNINDCENVSLKNIQILNNSINNFTLFRLNTEKAWFIDNFDIENNIIKGKICIVYSSYDLTINPILGINGFNKIYINNNNFENISQISCFNINDSIINEATLSNNNIHNFTNKFFGMITTNDSLYEENIRNNIKLVKVDNNYVFCDNDYLVESGEGSSYYCFVILEGDKCIYSNNHIEGMKQLVKTIPLYDCYASVNELYSFNNVFKNNMSFTSGNTFLFKSKGGNNDFIRYYNNNVYLIEKSWQQLFDENLTKYVYFIDIQSIPSVYSITNCQINVPCFYGNPSLEQNAMDYGNIIFNNNIIDYEKGDDGRALFSCKTLQEGRTILITNNTINAQNYQGRLLSVQQGETYKKYKSIIIRNNNIKCQTVVTSIKAETFIFENNTIECQSDYNISLFFSSRVNNIDNITLLNNHIIVNNNQNLYPLRTPFSNSNIYFSNTFNARISDNVNSGLLLTSELEEDFITKFYCEYEIYHTTGKQIMNFMFEYGHDENGVYIKAINASNNTETKMYITDNGFTIKTNDTTDITLSKARITTQDSKLFSIIPQINYSISGKSYIVKQTIKNMKIS